MSEMNRTQLINACLAYAANNMKEYENILISLGYKNLDKTMVSDIPDVHWQEIYNHFHSKEG